MSEERVSRVANPETGLEAGLTIVRGADGGACAVEVELSNPDPRHDLVLRVNTVTSAFVMLTVTDGQGVVLSKPPRRFDTSERQTFETVRMGPGTAHRWQVALTAQLDPGRIPAQGMRGRLVVGVAAFVAKAAAGAEPADADFTMRVLTLYDLDVALTQASLEKGACDPDA